MKTVPAIGQRVMYIHQSEWEKESRICVGTVTKIYRTYDYDFDDDDEPIIGTGRIRPVNEWHAAIKVDCPLPKWWAYGDRDVFAPDIESLHLEPRAKIRRRA